MTKQNILLLLVCTATLFLKVQAQSVLYVTNLFDSGAGSLRQQITDAFPGDTIRFQVTGTLILSSGELTFNKNLVIEGPGASLLTITCSSPDRLFRFSGNVRISKLTLLNGYSNLGAYSGGMTCTGGTLRVNNVRFENCTAGHLGDIPRGGALRASCDSLFVDYCDFINNGVASSLYHTSGGAIYGYAIKQYIRNCTFDSNQVDAGINPGNGVYHSYGYGGAVHLVAKTNSRILIDGCTFTNNVCNAVSAYSGGAMQGQGHAYGSAIHIEGLHTMLSEAIQNSTFTGNLAYGSGVTASRCFSYGTISLTTVPSSTIVTTLSNLILDDNEGFGANTTAGIAGIYSYRASVAMNNVAVTNNTSFNFAIKLEEAALATADYCNVSGNSSGGMHLRVIASSGIRNSLFSNNGKLGVQLDQLSGPNTTANTTFTKNTYTQGAALRAEHCTGPVNLINCTMMDDTATTAGQAEEVYIYNSPQVYFKNNIISTPTFIPDPLIQIASSTVVSGGGNIVRDNSASLYLSQPTDMNSGNAQLGTFDDHGGPTKTYSLLAASPAINLGGSDTLTIDQRGYLRDASSDAGAYEHNGTNPNLPLVLSQSGNTSVCVSATVVLSVTANNIPHDPVQFQWKKDNVDISGANSATLSITPSVAGSFVYTCELSNGEGNTTSAPITVTVLGLPNVVADGAATVCAGNSTGISATGATGYTWDNGLGAGSAHTVSPAVTTTYTVTGTDGNGCQNTSQVTVTVNQLPNVDAGNATAICTGSNTTISATGATGYTWDNGLGSGASHSVSPIATTTYIVTGTDGNGCQNTDQVTVTVNQLPNVDAGNAAAVCAGSSTTIAATGATSYTWDNGLGSGASHSVSPAATTTYTVTGTDGNGCQNTGQVTITVNQLPNVDAGTGTTFCAGNSTTISATGATGFTWDNGLGAGSSHTVSPAVTTTYTVTGTDGNGCQNTDQVTITVNQLPNVDAGNATAICTGSNTTISATGATGYTWDNGLGAGASHSVSPTATTTYTVTGTDGNGCQNTAQVTVTVNQLPNVDAGNAAAVCSGSSTTISATGAADYSWDNGLGAGASHSVSPTATTTYTVTGTDGNGCQNTGQVTITVNQLPNVDAGNPAAVCAGSSTTISASGAADYSWDNGLGAGASHSVSPAATTTYTVTGTDGNGCQNTDMVTITVNQLPNVSAGSNATICAGNATTITATGAASYTWNNGLGAGASHSVSPNATTTYTVTGTDGNGCQNTDMVTVIVNPLPNATATLGADQLTITATNVPATYSWIDCNNGFQTIGATGQSYTATANGSYAVIVTQNGCSDTSACILVDDVGLGEAAALSDLLLVPNPVIGKAQLMTNEHITALRVVDNGGREVAVTADLTTGLIDFGNVPAGNYFIEITTGSAFRVVKAIVID